MPRSEYFCCVCNGKYDTYEQDEQCENGHAKPVGVVDMKINYWLQYPSVITVEFSDGAKVKYEQPT